MLEKAEEQERLLEESAKELQDRKGKEEELRKALEEKEVDISMFVIFNIFSTLD
jgi:kinesin family protein 3/17